MRRAAYPRWVLQKKLTQATADKEIERMLAVRDALLRGEALQALVDKIEAQFSEFDQVPHLADLLTALNRRFPVPQ